MSTSPFVPIGEKEVCTINRSHSITNSSHKVLSFLPSFTFSCRHIVWRNVFIFTYMHLAALYGYYLLATNGSFGLILFVITYGGFGGLGITAGAHRLWAHRAYKATWQLRLLLAIFQTIAFQNHIHEWSRDHRVHHKFSETDADPHNAKRGFFFSHVGWLLVKKHPEVKGKGKTVVMSDLEQDPIVVWQRKYYMILMPILTFAFPTWFQMHCLHLDFWASWNITVFRWIFSLNCTWLVNSAAHLWGNKPYDMSINPSENGFVCAMAFGEGFHNYHHSFPYDYKASEFGDEFLNPTTIFIDFFANIGWAYDLKTVSKEVILRKATRKGDGTHQVYGNKFITSEENKFIASEGKDQDTEKKFAL